MEREASYKVRENPVQRAGDYCAHNILYLLTPKLMFALLRITRLNWNCCLFQLLKPFPLLFLHAVKMNVHSRDRRPGLPGF